MIRQGVPEHFSAHLLMHVTVSVFTLPLCVCLCHSVLVLQRHHCSPPCTAELIYKTTNQPRFNAFMCVCECVCPRMHLCVQPAQIYSISPHSSCEIEGNQQRDCSLSLSALNRQNMHEMLHVLLIWSSLVSNAKLKCLLCICCVTV